ncbi:sigma-70 family RNA polymerase sigma factor [Streptomyces sp. NPDC001340]
MPGDHELFPSDAQLTAQARESVSDDPAAELYRRHRSAVLSYALACCRDRHTAEDLVSEAFARTLQAVRSGSGPEASWRPYLLTTVRRIAAEWAGTARRTELSADFEQWLANLPDAAEPENGEERVLRLEDNNLVLRAFRSLPPRWQAVLWHTAVEEEPASKVAILLGMGASGVGSLASRAREGLREAYLAAHVESTSVSDECRRFSSLLGAAVRRAGRRRNKDLDRHLAECGGCRRALIELTDLNERLGSALPAGVLLWGGSAYVSARMAEAGASAASTAIPARMSDSPVSLDGDKGWWRLAKGSPLRSGALAGGAVTTIGLAALILPTPFDGGGEGSAPLPMASRPPLTVIEYPPPVTVTVTPSPSAPPRAEPSDTVSHTASEQSANAAVDLGAVRWSGSLRNLGTGMCVEPAGTAVVQNECDKRKDQVWETFTFKGNKDNTWLRNAVTGECIDYLHVRKEQFDNGVVNLLVMMGPCRADGEGQLFRFDPWWGESDDSYLVRAALDDGKPWDDMQLGRRDWWKNDSPPEKDARVVLTYNFYNHPQLRYRLEGR